MQLSRKSPLNWYGMFVVYAAFLILFSRPILAAPVQVMTSPSKNPGVKFEQGYNTYARLIDAIVEFPSQFYLVGKYCGQENAFYDQNNHSITICYELIDRITSRMISELAPDIGSSGAMQMAGGTILFVLLHEIGHAIIHEFNVPVLGREEDVADQIAAYIAIKLATTSSSTGSAIIIGSGWFFNTSPFFYTRKHFADEHSTQLQRQYNVMCWAYGSNPTEFGPLASRMGLPKERALRCPAEYKQMSSAMEQLIVPHFKQTSRAK